MSPTATTVPAFERTSPPAPTPVARAVRAVVAFAIVAGCVVAALNNAFVRALEATGTANLLNLLTADGARGIRDHYAVWITPTHVAIFEVTAECTVLLILIPLLLIAATMIMFTRTTWWRIALALTASIAIVVTANIARLAFIGWATRRWGLDLGYTMSHTFVGSVMGIIGFVAGLATLFLLIGARRKRKQSRKP